mmetsp:Transcript_44364/g.95576  ORF Transcript_44364/g.95576 Transcript_44364/m.95576 type:complete len:84 (+) Transcript_44364:248-499(+)
MLEVATLAEASMIASQPGSNTSESKLHNAQRKKNHDQLAATQAHSGQCGRCAPYGGWQVGRFDSWWWSAASARSTKPLTTSSS